MSSQDSHASLVFDTIKHSLDDVTMGTPVGEIVTAGRTRRRRRHRRLVGGATGIAAVTALAVALPAMNHPATLPPMAVTTGSGGSALHAADVAFILTKHQDGTIRVTWDKAKYFQDHAGLENALRKAGFPVLIKEGEFCAGAKDDVTLDPSGVGPGVTAVMTPKRTDDDTVEFVFKPSAMPAGKQLFIGYLTPGQQATHGRLGSVERLISVDGPLTCTDQPPPAHTAASAGERG
jgi:hypothetical protein